MASIDEILGEITPAQRRVKVCTRGDLSSEIEALEQQLAAHQREDALGNPRVREIAEQIFDLQTQAERHTHEFVIEALGKQQWRRLLAEHPPSKTQRVDGWDHDPDTFQPVAVAACCVSPTMTVDQARKLEQSLSDGQWALLWRAVMSANTEAGEIPKSGLATAVLRATAPSSTTAPREASPEASS